jgi:hypothetical protein
VMRPGQKFCKVHTHTYTHTHALIVALLSMCTRALTLLGMGLGFRVVLGH